MIPLVLYKSHLNKSSKLAKFVIEILLSLISRAPIPLDIDWRLWSFFHRHYIKKLEKESLLMERKQLQLKLRVKVETIWATRQCLLNYPFRASRVYVDSLNVRCRPLIDLNRVQDLKKVIPRRKT